MNNRFFASKTLYFIIAVSALIVLVSCNLPVKDSNRMNNTGNTAADNTGIINPGSIPENQQEIESGIITNPQNSPYNWAEPQTGGPTVTPIVLNVEKRGQEGSIIMRSDTDLDGNNSDPYASNPTGSTIPTALPAINQGGMQDAMELVSFNPVNGATVLPGEAIHLDITLRNSGSTTWQTSYKIIDYSNIAMAVQKEYNLPYPVAPGGTALISVYMTAPDKLGNYPENFRIQDSYGNVFGNFDYILTVGDFSYVTSIPTLTATITPTYYSAEGITATPDSLAWMCIDPERSKLQDCYSFCVEYSHREEFKYCFYNGVMYETPVPVFEGGE